MGRFGGKTCRLLTMLVLTFEFFLLEVIYGYISNSMALIADSFHMLSDVLALIVAFVCMKVSKIQRSPRNTFGWVRAEVLGALVNTVFLIALSFSVILESVQRLFDTEYIKEPQNVLIVGSVGLAVNLIGLVLFHDHGQVHGHSHGHAHGQKVKEKKGMINVICTDGEDTPKKVPHQHDHYQNGHIPDGETPLKAVSASGQMNIRGVWLHVLGDAFGSVVVIVNALANWQLDVHFVKLYLDPMLSLVISFIIIGTSIPLLKESSMVLLQTVPSHLQVAEIERKLLANFGDSIASMHEFHVWNLTGSKIVATLHVKCREGVDTDKLAKSLKSFFHAQGIHSTTIQMETAELSITDINQCTLKCPHWAISDGPCAMDVCCVLPTIVQRADSQDDGGSQNDAELFANGSLETIHM